jgi:membrane protein DedA with SNARE-associated domain/rhodanese-related sulfurtransferase
MDRLTLAVGSHGLLLVFVNVLAAQLGLPVPVVPTLIIAGALAAAGHLPLAALGGLCVGACLLADSLWYVVGGIYGIRVLKTLCRVSLEPDSCVSQTQSRFERWGVNSLVLAKFVPGLGIIAPPLAGAMHIGWVRFILLSLAGAALWTGVMLGTGMVFRTQIDQLVGHLDAIGGAAGVAAMLAVAAYVGFKWWDRARFYRSLRMARITVAELYDLMQAGAEPVVVDVRSTTARELEPHWIPGARHVALEAVDAAMQDLPRDREIILYCTCPSEASAAQVARVLMNHGFTRVRPLHGGLDAWVAAGYAVVGISRPDPPSTADPATRSATT